MLQTFLALEQFCPLMIHSIDNGHSIINLQFFVSYQTTSALSVSDHWILNQNLWNSQWNAATLLIPLDALPFLMFLKAKMISDVSFPDMELNCFSVIWRQTKCKRHWDLLKVLDAWLIGLKFLHKVQSYDLGTLKWVTNSVF